MDEDPELNFSPKFLNYYQELVSIFTDLSPETIKAVIIQYQEWEQIINILLQPNQDLPSLKKPSSTMAKSYDPQTPPIVPRQPLPAEMFGVSTLPTKFDAECHLYLPSDLVDIQIDFEHFGDFNDAILQDARVFDPSRVPQ